MASVLSACPRRKKSDVVTILKCRSRAADLQVCATPALRDCNPLPVMLPEQTVFCTSQYGAANIIIAILAGLVASQQP
eukprot:2706576-Rhodomonas_salina.1